MPRKHRFLAALLGILLILTLTFPALADTVGGNSSYAQTGDILPPDGDDSPVLPPDGDDSPSYDPSPDPGSDPSDDPSYDPGGDDPSGDDPSWQDPDDPNDPGSDDPNGDDPSDDPDFSDPGEGSDPEGEGGYTYEPPADSDDGDSDYTGGTVTNTARGSTGSTTPRRPQQILGGTASSGNSTGNSSGSQQTGAPVESSGPQYVTFARLNLRSNSISLTLFYGGAGCIALGSLGLIILLIVLVRSGRKNHRDRLIQEIAHAETQAQARSTQTAAVPVGGRHMRSSSLKHAASKDKKQTK